MMGLCKCGNVVVVVVVVVVVDLGFTTLLTCYVISVAVYSEREKSTNFVQRL